MLSHVEDENKQNQNQYLAENTVWVYLSALPRVCVLVVLSSCLVVQMQIILLYLQDFHVDTFFRQRWVDERLKFTNQTRPIIVPAKFVDRFWVPDIYFPNEKSAYLHTVVVPNEVIKIFPDGLVRHSSRYGYSGFGNSFQT